MEHSGGVKLISHIPVEDIWKMLEAWTHPKIIKLSVTKRNSSVKSNFKNNISGQQATGNVKDKWCSKVCMVWIIRKYLIVNCGYNHRARIKHWNRPETSGFSVRPVNSRSDKSGSLVLFILIFIPPLYNMVFQC